MCRRFATLSAFALVIRGSITRLSSLAFGKVVLIVSCKIKELAIFLNIAFLCDAFLLSCLPDFLCLIVYPYSLIKSTGGQFSISVPSSRFFSVNTSLISLSDLRPKLGVLSKSCSDFCIRSPM